MADAPEAIRDQAAPRGGMPCPLCEGLGLGWSDSRNSKVASRWIVRPDGPGGATLEAVATSAPLGVSLVCSYPATYCPECGRRLPPASPGAL